MTTTSVSVAPADEQLDPNGGRDLLDAVRALRPELEEAAVRAEDERTLPSNIVARFRELGLFWLKTPAELGGRPLHPLAFADLVEQVSYFDASAGWAMMIGCGSTGIAAGRLPDKGAARIFSSTSDLPVVAGQPHAEGGRARRKRGGYVVTGRWGFASGVHHADWVLGAAQVEGVEPGQPGSEFGFVAPRADATVHDNWRVAGLQGSGSSDFSLDEVFVPKDLTYDRRAGKIRRGGPLFHQEGVLFVGNEVPAISVGVAKRAIDDMIAMVGGFRRSRGTRLAERGVFHKELGQAKTRVDSARLYYRAAMSAGFEAACAGEPVPVEVQRAAMVSQTYVSETCVDVVSNLFRYGGGRALSLSHPMQRHLRNLFAARQHLAATEEHYETLGRALIEDWDASQS
ncbi:MAG: acyl-CoA dehydrogenase family protein [Acidimicrobiaceae bacterium]|nr:acyl-CoA dehydrogenase family protein [Acidimicrobiaceae bacterium]